jgi:RNA polymerase sigma-70 factor (ECF subfamily)
MDPHDALPRDVRSAWHRFADTYEPLRTDLYRYCRYLTRSPWDAEDLAQDAMARAFATLGRMGEAPPSPRAWLFRVASNLWIDRMRRAGHERGIASSIDTTSQPSATATREAAGTLLVQLAPQERAAVVLKDVFDLSLDEIATTLGTTVGAVKAALHRGRGKLAEPDASADRAPSRAVIDAFVDAFNAHDVDRVAALLLDSAVVDVVGATSSFGADANRTRMLDGMMFGSKRLANAAIEGGIEARFVRGALPSPPRAEARVFRGETIVLVWYAHDDGEHVRAIDRLVTDGDRIAHLSNYFFTSELIEEIGAELGVSTRINGHRFWLTGSCR